MGVSGSGKTTIGKLLSQTIFVPFFDADDYHSEENINKMKQGIPLNDHDRAGWLQKVNQLARAQLKNEGCIIACSALKQHYREILSGEIKNEVVFIYLEGSFDLILNRLQRRKGHFMPASLLQSQFDTLEISDDIFTVDINQQPDQIVFRITEFLTNV